MSRPRSSVSSGSSVFVRLFVLLLFLILIALAWEILRDYQVAVVDNVNSWFTPKSASIAPSLAPLPPPSFPYSRSLLSSFLTSASSFSSSPPSSSSSFSSSSSPSSSSSSFPPAASRILLFSIASRGTASAYRTQLASKACYARLHGYAWRQLGDKAAEDALNVFGEDKKQKIFHGWGKMGTMLNFIKTNEYDWLFFMDADLLITNVTFRVEEWITMAEELALERKLNAEAEKHARPLSVQALHAIHAVARTPLLDHERIHVISTDHNTALNNGAILARNSPWTVTFLNHMIKMRQKVDHEFCFTDNGGYLSALMDMLEWDIIQANKRTYLASLPPALAANWNSEIASLPPFRPLLADNSTSTSLLFPFFAFRFSSSSYSEWRASCAPYSQKSDPIHLEAQLRMTEPQINMYTHFNERGCLDEFAKILRCYGYPYNYNKTTKVGERLLPSYWFAHPRKSTRSPGGFNMHCAPKNWEWFDEICWQRGDFISHTKSVTCAKQLYVRDFICAEDTNLTYAADDGCSIRTIAKEDDVCNERGCNGEQCKDKQDLLEGYA